MSSVATAADAPTRNGKLFRLRNPRYDFVSPQRTANILTGLLLAAMAVSVINVAVGWTLGRPARVMKGMPMYSDSNSVVPELCGKQSSPMSMPRRTSQGGL